MRCVYVKPVWSLKNYAAVMTAATDEACIRWLQDNCYPGEGARSDYCNYFEKNWLSIFSFNDRDITKISFKDTISKQQFYRVTDRKKCQNLW